MKIISRFIREQQRYTKGDLRHLFEFDETGISQFIEKLKNCGVLKTVRHTISQKELSDLTEEDIETADASVGNDELLFVFSYVGLITTGSRIIKVFPKYILSENGPAVQMKQVLRVLEKYVYSKEQILPLFHNSGDDKNHNLLAVIFSLISDYHTYGIYNNSEDITEINGQGSVLWQKTIDESIAMVCRRRPCYMELYTKRTIDNDMDYFNRLHKCILTECSGQLEMSGLLELLEMEPLRLSEEELTDFGEKEYILDRLRSELNIQFDTGKQHLLRTLCTYIARDKKLMDEEQGISMYGTTAFHMIWEHACACVFQNQLDTPPDRLGLSCPLAEKYQNISRLSDIIDRPVWYGYDTVQTARRTLIPDLISAGHRQGRDYFYILDAKYYLLTLEPDQPLRGNPGVEDVTKQYLYQLAFCPFLEAHHISEVKNCFLLPTEGTEIIEKGYVRMDMLHTAGLQDIQIRLLPASMIFDHYLAGTHLNISLLRL